MTATKQTELLIDRKLLERLQERLDPHRDAVDWGMVCDAFHAQSAEPVQGEAVAYGDTDQLAALNKESSASCAVWNRPGRNRTALMTVAQHNRIMAAAKPDAELVDILKRVVDYYAEGEGELKCIAQDCRAKLAELQK
jgi:hypothetical protein